MDVGALSKGANAPVNGRRAAAVVTAGAVAVDVLTFQLGADGRVRSDGDVVFYHQPASPEGAVRLSATDTVTISFDALPPWVESVIVAAAVAGDEPTAPLPQHIDVMVTTEADQFLCSATGLTTNRSALLVEFYRRNGGWKLRNVSAGWEQGIAALFLHHGVTVDETPADSRPTPVRAGPDHELPPASPPAPVPAPVQPPFAPVPLPPPGSPPGGRTRKRIAWLAAVVVIALVLAAFLGRQPTTQQDIALPRAVAAPVVATIAPSPVVRSAQTAVQAIPSSPVIPSTSVAATSAATETLSAPTAVPTVRNRQNAQDAVTALEALRVAGRAPKTGYSRAQFGNAWTDDVAVEGGHNGCDTRNDVLRRDLAPFTIRAGSRGCVVTGGTLADPYTGRPLQFSAGKATTVQIDHVVALSDAWQTGAASLSAQQRQELANDPVNLQATASAVNQAKGDGDAATWLPPDKSYRCSYVARQVAVKAKYTLWVTAAERQAISTVLTTCGATAAAPLPRPTPASTRTPTSTATPTRTAIPTPAWTATRTPTSTWPPAPTRAATTTPTTVPSAAAEGTPEPVSTAQTTTETTTKTATQAQETTPLATTDDAGTYYASCAAARAAGAAPVHRGEPGYRAGLDRDDDGIACE